MNKENLKTLLQPLRDLVMSNRVAYKDYLGEETVETPEEIIGTYTPPEGEPSSELDYLLTWTSDVTELILGKIYRVRIGNEVWNVVCTNYRGLNALFTPGIDPAAPPADVWSILSLPTEEICFCTVQGIYANQALTLSLPPTTTVQNKYNIKKLAYDLLPDKIVKATDSAYSRADSAYSRADSAYSRANSAYSRADSAYSRADSAYRHTLSGNYQTLKTPILTKDLIDTPVQSDWVSRETAVTLKSGELYYIEWTWGGTSYKGYYQYRTDLTEDQTGDEDITCGFWCASAVRLYDLLTLEKLAVLHNTSEDLLAVRVIPKTQVTSSGSYLPLTLKIFPVASYSNIAPMTLPLATFHSPGAVIARNTPSSSQTTPVAIDNNGYMWVDTQNITLVSSDSGKKFKLLVDDTGALSTEEVVEDTAEEAAISTMSLEDDAEEDGGDYVIENEG